MPLIPDPTGGFVSGIVDTATALSESMVSASMLASLAPKAVPTLRAWHLKNLDTQEEIIGQFEAEDVSDVSGANYAEHTSINRQRSVLQFTRGTPRILTWKGRLFAQDSTKSVRTTLATLIAWTVRDDKLQRPPVLHFWSGDGHVEMTSCVMTLGNISYGRPTAQGSLREVEFTATLREYVPFDLGATTVTDTRYHRASDGDYYEMICWREYKNPILGDAIRKRHPTKPNVQVGDVIKLPAPEGVAKLVIEPKSIAISTAYGRKATPQRTLRLLMLDLRNRTFVSSYL